MQPLEDLELSDQYVLIKQKFLYEPEVFKIRTPIVDRRRRHLVHPLEDESGQKKKTVMMGVKKETDEKESGPNKDDEEEEEAEKEQEEAGRGLLASSSSSSSIIDANSCYQHCQDKLGGTSSSFVFNLYSDTNFIYCSCCVSPPQHLTPLNNGALTYLACQAIQINSYIITYRSGKKMVSSSVTVKAGAIVKVVVEMKLNHR